MIQPQELRIGNWVKEIESERAGYLIQWVSSKKIKVKLSHSRLIADVDEFEPIPLTEDWLLRFGFEREGVEKKRNGNGYDYQPEDVYTLWTDYRLNENVKYQISKWYCRENEPEDESGFWFYDNYIIKCNYVHQLQNLYHALTGKELTIDEG